MSEARYLHVFCSELLEIEWGKMRQGKELSDWPSTLQFGRQNCLEKFKMSSAHLTFRFINYDLRNKTFDVPLCDSNL